MNTKKIISLAIGISLLMPSITFAAPNNNFCTQFSDRSTVLDQRMMEKEAKLSSDQTQRIANLAKKQANRDAKLETERAKADAKRSEQYTALDAKATTDEQKAAVATFKTTVAAAITARRSAIDAAMQAFRTGMDQLVTSHKTSLQSIVSTYKTAVDAAKAKAQASCTAGTLPATIRVTFLADMQAARDAMQTNRKSIEKIGAQAKALAATRNAAVKKAGDDFKIAVEKARTDLKAAF